MTACHPGLMFGAMHKRTQRQRNAMPSKDV